MNELKRALMPVKRRMRLALTVHWFAYGAFAAAVCVVLLRAASFLWPFPTVRYWALATCAVVPGVCALISWMWPISQLDAARQADALGLEARAQTAVMLNECDTPMALLQRKDAISSLHALEPKQKMALRIPRASLIGTAVCLLLIGASFLIPNPQAQALRERAAFRAEMTKQAQKVDDGAASLDAEEAETPEVRRLLGELAQSLRQSNETREALQAVDTAERKITQMQNAAVKDALSALRSAGMNALAAALEQNDREAAQAALEAEGSELSRAAAGAENASVKALLQAAAKALQNADQNMALQNLEKAVQGSSASCTQGMALTAMVRSVAARMATGRQGLAAANGINKSISGSGQGAGNAQGTNGKAAGSGAGQGSSNLDAGVSAPAAGRSTQGAQAPVYKMEEYETIYDPIRMGNAGETVHERGQIGQGMVTEAEMGTGLGTANGDVPYAQVLPQYRQSAVEAAQNANLPAYARQWIDTYFHSLAD